LAAQRERLNSIFSSLKSLNEVPEGWGNRLPTNGNRFRGAIVLRSVERLGEPHRFGPWSKPPRSHDQQQCFAVRCWSTNGRPQALTPRSGRCP